MADEGSSHCTAEVAEDGTLIGLYLLIAGIILVVFTLAWVFVQKHCRIEVSHEKQASCLPSSRYRDFIYPRNLSHRALAVLSLQAQSRTFKAKVPSDSVLQHICAFKTEQVIKPLLRPSQGAAPLPIAT